VTDPAIREFRTSVWKDYIRWAIASSLVLAFILFMMRRGSVLEGLHSMREVGWTFGMILGVGFLPALLVHGNIWKITVASEGIVVFHRLLGRNTFLRSDSLVRIRRAGYGKDRWKLIVNFGSGYLMLADHDAFRAWAIHYEGPCARALGGSVP